MIDRVRQFIDEHRLLANGDRVIVALSGGADSVVLLHALISLKEEYDLRISAVHFHHGIRGEEADRDMQFAEECCNRWDIPFYCGRADVPAEAAISGESIETCARRLRYCYFDELLDRIGGKLATAHHRDDNAETVLWNLTRGGGIGGMSGIPVKRGRIIRPLLCVSREEIEAYCRENGLDYVTDSTNLSDDCARNIIRHRVMPALRELNPSVGESIARNSQLMREAEEYFKYISEKELKIAESTYGYSCEVLLRLPEIILRYAVKQVLENVGAPVDFQHIALIMKEMRSGGAVPLGGGFTASCAQGFLRVVVNESADNDICIPFSEYIKDHGTRVIIHDGQPIFSADNSADKAKINNLLLKHGIPCDIISCNTVFRTRRAGDTFTDARRGVTKSLKKLMNEMKIPREKRDRIPVVAEGSVILWMQGCGTSAQGRVDLSRDGEIIIMGV